MAFSWRFIDTGVHTGEYNMAFDQRLVRELGEGIGLQTLRLYQWKPRAISLGYNQPLEDIDVGKCAADGIDVVRRPTGGRAILHAEELTYSIAMFPDGNIQQVYNRISGALIRGLALFGLAVDFRRMQPAFGTVYKSPSAIPCFTSSARYEIEWKGRKLVGSAQRRIHHAGREVVLQHGSLLIGSAHRQLVEYLSIGNRQLCLDLREQMEQKTIDLQAILGHGVDMKRLSSCITKGFEEELCVEFSERSTTTRENTYA